MSYYIKLNKSISVPEFEELEETMYFGENKEKTVLQYLNVNMPNSENLYKIIPKEFRKDFRLNSTRINSQLGVHLDTDATCRINFYMVTDNCITRFFLPKVDYPFRKTINGKVVFSRSDLNEIDSFVAQPGEAWLLNVQKLHDVTPPNGINFCQRRAITLFTTKFSFIEVSEMLKQTGYID